MAVDMSRFFDPTLKALAARRGGMGGGPDLSTATNLTEAEIGLQDAMLNRNKGHMKLRHDMNMDEMKYMDQQSQPDIFDFLGLGVGGAMAIDKYRQNQKMKDQMGGMY